MGGHGDALPTGTAVSRGLLAITSQGHRLMAAARAAASTLAAKVFASAPTIPSSRRSAPSLTLTWEDERTSALVAAPALKRSDQFRQIWELLIVMNLHWSNLKNKHKNSDGY